MTLSFPQEFSDEEPVKGSALQEVLDIIGRQFPVGAAQASRVPQVRAYNSAAIAIPNTTVTAVTLNSERWDDTANPMHSTSANTSRLTCFIPGLYVIDGHNQWAAAAGGVQRYSAIRITFAAGGTTTPAEQVKTNSATLLHQTSVHEQYRLAAGDYAELVVFQDSGGNLNVTSPELAMHWVSP